MFSTEDQDVFFLIILEFLLPTSTASLAPPVLNFGNGAHVKDEELALYILKRSDFDREEAVKTYVKCCNGEMKAEDLDAEQEVRGLRGVRSTLN